LLLLLLRCHRRRALLLAASLAPGLRRGVHLTHLHAKPGGEAGKQGAPLRGVQASVVSNKQGHQLLGQAGLRLASAQAQRRVQQTAHVGVAQRACSAVGRRGEGVQGCGQR
jgi:hypothetical protein